MSQEKKSKLEYIKPEIARIDVNSGVSGEWNCLTGSSPVMACGTGGGADSCGSGTSVSNACSNGSWAGTTCGNGESVQALFCTTGSAV